MLKSIHFTAVCISTLLFAAVSCDLFSGNHPLTTHKEYTDIDFSFSLQQPFDLLLGADAAASGIFLIYDQNEKNMIDEIHVYLYKLHIYSPGQSKELNYEPVKLLEFSRDLFNPTLYGYRGEIIIPFADIIDNLPVEAELENFSSGDVIGLQWKVMQKDGTEITETCPLNPIGYHSKCTPVKVIHTIPE